MSPLYLAAVAGGICQIRQAPTACLAGLDRYMKNAPYEATDQDTLSQNLPGALLVIRFPTEPRSPHARFAGLCVGRGGTDGIPGMDGQPTTVLNLTGSVGRHGLAAQAWRSGAWVPMGGRTRSGDTASTCKTHRGRPGSRRPLPYPGQARPGMAGLPAALAVLAPFPLRFLPLPPPGRAPLLRPDGLFRRRHPGVGAVLSEPAFQLRDSQLQPPLPFQRRRQLRPQHRVLGILRLDHGPQPGQQLTLLPRTGRRIRRIGHKPRSCSTSTTGSSSHDVSHPPHARTEPLNGHETTTAPEAHAHSGASSQASAPGSCCCHQ